MSTIIYLIIGGVALFWLLGMGGLQQIQGMIGGSSGNVSVGSGSGIDVAGIHVGADGVKVPGLADISTAGGITNVNNNVSRLVNTGPGSHSQRLVQVNGKTIVNESNLGRLMSI